MRYDEVKKIIQELPLGENEDALKDLLRVTEDMLVLHAHRKPCWKIRQKIRIIKAHEVYNEKQKKRSIMAV